MIRPRKDQYERCGPSNPVALAVGSARGEEGIMLDGPNRQESVRMF